MNLLLQDTYAEVLDDEVVEDEREARRALAQADTSTREVDGEAELGRPRGVGVRERKNLRRPQVQLRHPAS